MSESNNYAAFHWRVAACLVDFLIVMAATAIISLIAGFELYLVSAFLQFDQDTMRFAIQVVSWTVGVLVPSLYFAGLESSPWQATLGKRFFGMKVTTVEGRSISFPRALIRFLLKFFSGFLFGLAYLVCLFTERKQALHDILINTVVLKESEESPSDLG